MRLVIWLILLFVSAVVSATWLGPNDALVSFHQGGWRLDMSLNLFLLVLLAVVGVLFMGLRAVDSLLSLPTRAREWRELKRERAARQAFQLALTELFAARYARAQRAALQALALQPEVPSLAGDVEFGVAAELLAASSMHRLQDRAGRDASLARVMGSLEGRSAGSSADGARLLAAEWALDDRDADRGSELLASLPPGVARRTHALRLKLQAARQRRRPGEALQTARLLAKHQGFTADAGVVLLRTLASETLDQAFDQQQLEQAWQQLDDRERRDPWVVARAARAATRLGLAPLGARWLRPVWERAASLTPEERAQMALATMDCVPGLASDWLPLMDQLLAQHGREPAIVALVGLVCAERQLWGKARALLTQAAQSDALASVMRRRVLRLLARMARDSGDAAEAAACDQQAAALD